MYSPPLKKTLGVIALTLVASIAGAADKPGEWKPLLDAKLSQFDVYLSYRGDQIMSVLKGTAQADLKPIGLNPPGKNVFTMIEQGGKFSPVLGLFRTLARRGVELRLLHAELPSRPFRAAFDYHCRLDMPADPIQPAMRADCLF